MTTMIPEKYRKYEKTVTISVANFNPVWGNKPATLDKIKRMTVTASQMGSNIIAFPEMALSGYECSEDARINKQPCAMHRQAAETIPGPSTLELAGLAKERDIYVLAGMAEVDEGDPSVYNTVAVIGPEGIVGKYRKINLSPGPVWTEQICFKHGNELPVFETRFGPIGVQICYDFWCFPELTRILWLKGARIIFNCTAASAGPGRNNLVTWQTACRSSESRVYAASSNMVGKERTNLYCGSSNISGPDFPAIFHIFAQAEDREELVTATLGFERLHYFNNLIDVRKDLAMDLIISEYRRIAGK